jgi:type IX secretion system PorP/SprF family membrane protein
MKKLLLLIMFIATGFTARCQGPVFSQFYSTSLYLNPALAGVEGDTYLGVNYRSQWSNVNLPFRTFQFSAIHPFAGREFNNRHIGGGGVSFFSDHAGPADEFVTQGMSVAAALNVIPNKNGKHKISVGAQVAYIQIKLNMNALQWSSQYNAALGYDESMAGENLSGDRNSYPLVNSGIVWQFSPMIPLSKFKSFFHGVAVKNINSPHVFFKDDKGMSPEYTFHGGMLWRLGDKLESSPSYLIERGVYAQTNIGVSFSYYMVPAYGVRSSSDTKLTVGSWYRVGDAFIFTAMASTAIWSIGVSYDTNTTSLGRNFKGANSVEVSLGYRISKQKDLQRFSSPLI